MLKKLAFGSVGLLLLVSPVFAVALSLAPLSDDFGTGTTEASSIYCPQLSSTFQRRATDASTGGQVTELQKFLVSYYDDAPENMIIGTYGPTTFRFTTRFQREQGFPTDAQKGIIGSMTRTAIAKVCGGGVSTPTQPNQCQPVPVVDCAPGYSPVSGGTDARGCTLRDQCKPVSGATLNASPVSGAAPLEVYFRGTGSVLTSSAGISFGDGTMTGGGNKCYPRISKSGHIHCLAAQRWS